MAAEALDSNHPAHDFFLERSRHLEQAYVRSIAMEIEAGRSTIIGMLGLALKTLPIGTAYAVWTGIGAVGTAILGIMLFGDPAGFARIACIGLIIAGIVGLKLVT